MDIIMEVLGEFLQTYGSQILMAVITAICGYVGRAVKRTNENLATSQTKKDVVNTCVKFVEQIYKDIHGDEKLQLCIQTASDQLKNKGIQVDEYELWMMIEACVNEFNSGLKKG